MDLYSQRIGENIYEVSDGRDVLIYAPFKNLIAKKWPTLHSLQRILIQCIPDQYTVPQNTLVPSVLELDMSHSCNLNCIYCSINSNDTANNDRLLKMDPLLAKKAIDRVIEISKKADDPFTVVFIGKGEPTLNWNVLTGCVEYIKKQKWSLSAKGKTIVVTNGIITKEKAYWLARNIDHIALSWDGDEETQNQQRPFLRGGNSYAIVERTASIFKEVGAYFEIRTTWTSLNVSKMVECTKKFIAYNPFGLNYQPLLLTGKGYNLEIFRADTDMFVENFMKSKKIAESKDILVMMPSVNTTKLNRKFCHAYEGTGFCLSANGSLTACECVFGDGDNLSEKYLTYGKIIGSEIIIDEEKISLLRSLNVDAISGCYNCFVRWHCAGGCLNTHLQSCNDPLENRKNVECNLTKNIVWNTLKDGI